MKNQKDLFDMPNFIGQSNSDFEELVLGCFINYSDTYTDNADAISINDFSLPETRVIFYCIIGLIEDNVKIDIATICNYIKKNKWDETFEEKKRGFNLIIFVEDICDRVSTDENLKDHINELNMYGKRRSLSLLSEKINKNCNDFDNPDKIIEETSQELYSIQESSDVNEISPEKSIKNWINEKEDKTVHQFIYTGLASIDNFTGGFKSPDQIIVAANASMGKTSLVLQIFDHNMKTDVPCGFFSLEMDSLQLMDRLFALNTNINLRKLRRKELNKLDWDNIHRYAGLIENKQFFIDDKATKLSSITNKIRKWVIRHKVKMVVIDYMQLVECDSNANNREQEIATISRRFKQIARELGIVIFALSQLNRNNAGRQDKRPVLSDLRESGSIEQDADVVMFIHREEYYQPGTKTSIENAEVIFAKGRSIGVGSVDLFFKSELTKFYDSISDAPESEQQIHAAIAMNRINEKPPE